MHYDCFYSHNVLVGMVFPEDAGGGYSDDEGGGFECLPTPTGEKSAASQKVGWTYCTCTCSSVELLHFINHFPPVMGKKSVRYNFYLSTTLQGLWGMHLFPLSTNYY